MSEGQQGKQTQTLQTDKQTDTFSNSGKKTNRLDTCATTQRGSMDGATDVAFVAVAAAGADDKCASAPATAWTGPQSRP